MAKKNKSQMNLLSISASLVSLHYGLGFLLGTAEMVYKNGPAGSLYAFMCALGLFFLAFLSPFYWQKKYPIWTLLSKKYGQKIKNGTIFLSWFWMIGVLASQALGSAYIVNLFSLSVPLSLFLVIIIFSLFSLLPIQKLSKILLILLLLNSSVLLYGIFKLSSPAQLIKTVKILPSQLFSTNPLSSLGVALPTILITMLGMDFHQFVVQAKNRQKAVLSTLFASLILALIVFLPLLIVVAAQSSQILPTSVNGKQVIPLTLQYLGKQVLGQSFANLFLLAILVVALGSGSCLSRIINKTFLGFDFIPKKFRQKNIIIILNSLIVFLLAYKGGTLVSLIVSFYIIYIAGVFVPFIAYLLEDKKIISFPSLAVEASMFSGTLLSICLLVFSKTKFSTPELQNNLEFVMISSSVLASSLTLLLNKFLIKQTYNLKLNALGDILPQGTLTNGKKYHKKRYV